MDAPAGTVKEAGHGDTCKSRSVAGPSTGATGGRWQAGVSGNPAGRRPGTSDVARLRAAIAVQMPDIVAKLVAKALHGDISAARLLLERVVPPLRPSDEGVRVSLPASSLSDQVRAILDAMCAGEVTPSQAARLLAGLSDLARLVEVDELEARVRALEVLRRER